MKNAKLVWRTLVSNFLKAISEWGDWENFSLNFTKIWEENGIFTIRILGSKMRSALTDLTEVEYKKYIRVSRAIGASLEIVPCTKNHLSLDFFWVMNENPAPRKD